MILPAWTLFSCFCFVIDCQQEAYRALQRVYIENLRGVRVIGRDAAIYLYEYGAQSVCLSPSSDALCMNVTGAFQHRSTLYLATTRPLRVYSVDLLNMKHRTQLPALKGDNYDAVRVVGTRYAYGEAHITSDRRRAFLYPDWPQAANVATQYQAAIPVGDVPEAPNRTCSRGGCVS